MSPRRVVATAIAAAGLIATAGVTSAAATANHQSRYAHQAAQAGLSSTQAEYLQAKIESVLAATPGARQLSANTIEINGARLAIGAPGQTAVRPIGLAPGAAAAGVCPYDYLCTYHNGTPRNYYYCTTIYLSNWTGLGYILNNQTTGTISYFYRIDRSVYIKDVAPDETNREVNWNPIWSFKVC
jgi:hypothetical protein